MFGFEQARTAAIPAFASLALAASGCGSGKTATSSSPKVASTKSPSQLAPVHGTYRPLIDAANFVTVVDNRYFPLTPGTTLRYEGVRDGRRQTDEVPS